jgi:Zn-dependent alcohol dehydrogenase
MAAVVTRQLGSCSLEDLDLRAPAARDVVVRIEASGVGHSDVSVMSGELPMRLPVVLGHEGAGVVSEVGADVTTVRVGDRVV